MYVIDELLSPLITPFILYFVLRHKASDIIDFLRNFTIDVTGVGDVCSFAGMDIKKHGNPEVNLISSVFIQCFLPPPRSQEIRSPFSV